MVHAIPDLSDNWERSESSVRELPRGSRGIDVTSIQEYPVSGLIFWGWGSPLVIVFCHIILGLNQGCFCFLQCSFRSYLELVNGLHL